MRYNISQNDRDKTFEFAQGCPKGTMIYNNTIYSDQLLERGVFFLSNTGAGQGVNDTFAFNNVCLLYTSVQRGRHNSPESQFSGKWKSEKDRNIEVRKE